VDGIVLLDKPAGLSSNQVLQRVRRLLGAAKAGHAGTLDPIATGMLPLCFGQATKACGQLLGASKAYRAVLVLGRETDTGDAAGTVTKDAAVPPLASAAVDLALQKLVGGKDQVPPMYSALKHQGRRLYELARRGEDIPRAARRITIERLTLVRHGPRDLEFEVVCSKGTYVRVLGAEIAAALGTVGHLSALRRLWIEPFAAEDMVTLETIEQWAGHDGGAEDRPCWLRPVDLAFHQLPRLDLDRVQSLHLRQGREISVPEVPAGAARARAYGPDGRFLGLVVPTGGDRVRVERLYVPGASAAKPDQT
jgi:tRNA pseudouridine55 synthase